MSVEAELPEVDMENLADEDRGDALTPVEKPPVEDKKTEEAPKRDDKGRFVKEKADEKPEEKEEPEAEEAQAEADEAEQTEGEAEEKEEPKDDTAGKKIPYSRFKELVDQNKQLKAQLADSAREAKQADKQVDEREAQVKAFNEKLDGLYVKVEEARADGDTKQAAALQREIDRMNQAIARAEAQHAAAITTQQHAANTAFNEMRDYLVQARPILDADSPEFDKSVYDAMDFNIRAYEAQGMSAPEALRYAASLIFREDPFAPPSRDTDTSVKTEPKAPAVKKTDVAKNLDALKKSPPAPTARASNADVAIDPENLSEEEFDKLPESKKRELRGDVL